MKTIAILAIVLAGALAACQTVGTDSAATSNQAYLLSTRLADLIGRCWFAGDPAFADTIYSPERNADQSRILIVKKSDPTGLPLLVVEPKSATVVDVYGPLMATADGVRLRADVDRWVKGGEGCG